MKFELNEEEVKRYSEWKKEHDKNCRYLYTGAAGGRMSFCFAPNALGMTEKTVRCACGAIKHLSDPGDD